MAEIIIATFRQYLEHGYRLTVQDGPARPARRDPGRRDAYGDPLRNEKKAPWKAPSFVLSVVSK
jgi:hypothetical protein